MKDYMSTTEAAEILDYTPRHVGFLIRNGDIKAVKKWRQWLIKEKDLKMYIKKREPIVCFGEDRFKMKK